MSVWRRVKSALSTGLTWAVVWSIAGATLSPLLAALAHASGSHVVLNAVIFGIVIGWYGFLAGTIFSGIVAVVARRRTLNELSLWRAGLWGTIASLVFTVPPMIYMRAQQRRGPMLDDVIYFSASLVLCTGCSVATLLLARRGATLQAATNPIALGQETQFDALRKYKQTDRVTTAN